MTLHIAPGDSAAGSLIHAIKDAGCDDRVLSWRDDLSCGPITSDAPQERAKWWAQFYDDRDIEADLKAFWERVSTTDDRLVVWFGRHSASELAFFLAWADRLGDRPYELIDVTGQRLPFNRRDGSSGLIPPTQSVALIQPGGLRSMLGSEQPISMQLREESRRRWQILRAENAPFRIVTEQGLASAPVGHFDPLILERATQGWRKVARVVGDAMGCNGEPYMQVGPTMLLARLVALVGEGKLLADGDPWDWHSCRIRLPDEPLQ
jgi:hypothetical protein